MKDIKRIMVMSRSTMSSRKAIHYGFEMAENTGAQLYITHVYSNIFNMEGGNIFNSQDELREEYNLMQREARADLDELIAREEKSASPVKIREIEVEGPVYDEISDLIRKEEIDLLVMPAHPEGHIESYLFDHDNQRLIRRMPCSIFLVRE